jgi:tetratricopeptide (TPR) repeat protein
VLGGTGVGLLAFGVLLGVLVVRYTAPAPPDPMTGMPGMGTMPGTSEAPGPSASPSAVTGGGRLAAIPTGTLDGMLRAAHASLDAGRYQEAIAAYRAVLKREPANVDAITHLGVILAVAGHADDALAAFDRALAINPDDLHALWEKARALQDLRQDFAGAIAAWERVVTLTPPGQDREQAEARIRDARARLAAAPQPP